VLKDFSLFVRRAIISQVVNFLLEAPANILSSQAHIKWVMETCGQGFNLPMEDETIINHCTELYRRWALESQYRPAAFDEQPQLFLQVIFLFLLFF
jgi:hypothetical protein